MGGGGSQVEKVVIFIHISQRHLHVPYYTCSLHLAPVSWTGSVLWESPTYLALLCLYPAVLGRELLLLILE